MLLGVLLEAAAARGIELPQLDASLVTMMCCLFGVPIITACMAFLLVEMNWQTVPSPPRPEEAAESLLRYRSRLPASHDRLQPMSASTLASGAPVHPPQFGIPASGMSLPGPRATLMERSSLASQRLPPVLSGGAGSEASASISPFAPGFAAFHAAVPPPVPPPPPHDRVAEPRLSSATAERLSPPPPPSILAGADSPSAGPPRLPAPAEDHEPRNYPSPLSMALFIRNPDGVVVRVEGDLGPSPQVGSIVFSTVKEGSTETPVLRALLDESSVDTMGVHVETAARHQGLAVVDTRDAGQRRGCTKSPEGHSLLPIPYDDRQVNIHRAVGDTGGKAGKVCARVVPVSKGQLSVVFLLGSDVNFELSVYTTAASPFAGGHVDRVVDSKARQWVKRCAPDSENEERLWIRSGVDLALIACIIIAVQKLRD
mmetsp:Transcript_71848/g.150090  ORF Transcript_71848/g.150090 Transcript_71848/m.150090 type:complete len:428 (+) Transcript_71848:226-1509(+)|eukprot:CAMPEP_0206562632 /NCGR_PEP_ID=MMETSP0325_2-20121206/22367_1 /ASSEMBLY_ACC=CAM_ASM_000347 /TAXON_ID=2866 /ORGANISM="Crypthecodinium cohnii, Strain Seligo" /LENGTH=427 /DNA_ID=CAMNT_0054064885 /DNA_START=144 /DNA_END=1427 /DNA_ORIENTATION=-